MLSKIKEGFKDGEILNAWKVGDYVIIEYLCPVMDTERYACYIKGNRLNHIAWDLDEALMFCVTANYKQIQVAPYVMKILRF